MVLIYEIFFQKTKILVVGVKGCINFSFFLEKLVYFLFFGRFSTREDLWHTTRGENL